MTTLHLCPSLIQFHRCTIYSGTSFRYICQSIDPYTLSRTTREGLDTKIRVDALKGTSTKDFLCAEDKSLQIVRIPGAVSICICQTLGALYDRTFPTNFRLLPLGSPNMEVVTSYCKSCNSEVGRFRNSWYGIGNTYYSPVYQPLSTDGMEATGDIYEAARDSQIADRYGSLPDRNFTC